MGKQFFRLVIWLTYLDLVILVMVSGKWSHVFNYDLALSYKNIRQA